MSDQAGGMKMDKYITKSGDTWDMVAKIAYNDESQIGRLMEANLPLLDYFIFPEGVEITIPALPEKDWTMPDWRS